MNGLGSCMCITSPCNCAATMEYKMSPQEKAQFDAEMAASGPDRFANAMSGMKYLALAAAVLFFVAIWMGRD